MTAINRLADWMWRLETLLLSIVLSCFGAAALAETFDAVTLQRLLQASPRPEVRFTESRESPWLSAPAVSSGTLVMQPGLLEKRVEAPRRETYRLLADRMQVESVGRDQAVVTKELSFSEAPAVAALAHSLRLVMAGDLAALREHFDLAVSGEARLWSVRLVPRRTSISRTLQQIDMQGSYGQLMVIVTQEAKGERTTTRLLAPVVAPVVAPAVAPVLAPAVAPVVAPVVAPTAASTAMPVPRAGSTRIELRPVNPAP